ncbi:hypothetical protein VPNG_05731 [Cytospora leucostoma]|uniref:Uncharacterized protein n=1 Tax=Cytospora leucostoma TaxID=1230097 RepID=A0A423X029_9PEZI|nr:hypothetical protein VPNG_05731 [Cytospora leucostoma]
MCPPAPSFRDVRTLTNPDISWTSFSSGVPRFKGCLARTLITPAIIALIVFLLATYILLPLWRRYRSSRYGAYLPIETISSGTQTLRNRIQNAIARWVVPSTWRERLQDRLVVAGSSESDNGYDSDEGEELDEVPEDEDLRRRLEREAGRSRSSGRPDLQRRLSRDLEEGFRDDSDEEVEPAVRTR